MSPCGACDPGSTAFVGWKGRLGRSGCALLRLLPYGYPMRYGTAVLSTPVCTHSALLFPCFNFLARKEEKRRRKDTELVARRGGAHGDESACSTWLLRRGDCPKGLADHALE